MKNEIIEQKITHKGNFGEIVFCFTNYFNENIGSVKYSYNGIDFYKGRCRKLYKNNKGFYFLHNRTKVYI